MNDLKRCPFCGHKVEKIIAPLMKTVMFVCEACGADVCFFNAEHDPEASEAWNKRNVSDPEKGYDDGFSDGYKK